MTPREIEEQIQDFVDGTLDEAASDVLRARLKSDPALLEIYCSYAELESAFRRMRASRAALGEGITAIHHGATVRMQRRSFGIAIASAAAALALLGTVLGLIFAPDPPPMASLRTSPGSILDISHIATEKETPPPGTLMPGSRVKLDQGTLELTFSNGVRSIVRGPADLTLQDKDQLSLQKGTAWVLVPPEAIGFKVQTPGMTVTDLGTEFGVRTRPYSLDEVHVFRGKVQARTHRGVKATTTLTSGMARVVGIVGHLSEISADRGHFLTTLPDSLPHLHWSFDDGPQSATAGGNHPAAGSERGRLVGLENPQAFQKTEGRFGQAIASTRAFAEARSDWAGVEGDAPRTIAYWIKLESGVSPSVLAHTLVGWGSHTLTPFNPNPAFLTFLRLYGDHMLVGGSFGGYFVTGVTPIREGLWHHFAVVYNGRSLPDGRPDVVCYLDGRPEPMTPQFVPGLLPPEAPEASAVRTVTADPESIPLTLFPCNWSNDRLAENLQLALDELYVFEAALSEEQVRNLYQKNQIHSSQSTNDNP